VQEIIKRLKPTNIIEVVIFISLFGYYQGSEKKLSEITSFITKVFGNTSKS